MAKKGRPRKVKRGRPKKVMPTIKVKKAKKVELKVKKVKKPKPKAPVVPKAPKPIIIEKPIIYKEEIVVLGKKVKRLHDERDTDLQFHCGVSDGTTAHFDKELFKQ